MIVRKKTSDIISTDLFLLSFELVRCQVNAGDLRQFVSN